MPDSRSQVAVGSRWRNRHTGEATRVLAVEPPRPTDFLARGSLMVRHEGGSTIIEAWLQHWEPADGDDR